MLTKEEILTKATFLWKDHNYCDVFIEGATWANEQNAQEIAELKQMRSELAVQVAYRDKAIAELVGALRELKLSVGKSSTQVPTKDLYAWNLAEKTLAKYEK